MLKLKKKEKDNNAYLACCGPTLPTSWAELAVIWKSAIAPDSIPKGDLHFTTKKRRNLLIFIKEKKLFSKK